MSLSSQLRYKARVDIHSHNISFTKINSPELKEALYQYCLMNLVSYASVYRPGRGYQQVKKKVYAASNAVRSEFRFHAHLRIDLFRFLKQKGFDEKLLDIHEHDPDLGVAVKFGWDESKSPHDYQENIADYFLSEGRSKVTTLQTGKGKSLVAMYTMRQYGRRTAISVPGKYIHKWVGDVKKGLKLSGKDIMVVRGSKHLISAINLGLAGEIKAKAIIVSATTLYNFYKEHEVNGTAMYGIHPNDLYKVLGVGLRLIDETHENQHLNFKQDLYGHVSKAIYLSATLDSDDKFNNKMLQIAYPEAIRFSGLEYHCYISVTALNYHVEDVDRFRYMGRQKMYSHVTFEESVLKSKKRREAFGEMILSLVETEFLEERPKGMKCLVFAATIEMCTYLWNYLSSHITGITIARYVGEDDDEILYTNDLVVTTLKSAGTAVDIPGLDVVFLTPALGSKQQNLQALGRLREHRDQPDRSPRYYYLNASNISKHQEYHQRKIESFKGRVKTHRTLNTDFRI